MESRRATWVNFAEPLFYRKRGNLTYVRNTACNEEDPPAMEVPSIMSNPHEWERSYHYMSSGEVCDPSAVECRWSSSVHGSLLPVRRLSRLSIRTGSDFSPARRTLPRCRR